MRVEASEEQVASILAEYKSEAHTDPETGELLFGDLPIIFSRAEIMSNIYLELENLVGESALAVMKRIGKAYGEKFYGLILEEQPGILESKEITYQFICAETQAIGWGKIMLEDDGECVIITSKEGLASGRTFRGERNTPIDSYFLGYFEGFLNHLNKTTYYSDEVECVAKGDGQCRMVFSREPRY